MLTRDKTPVIVGDVSNKVAGIAEARTWCKQGKGQFCLEPSIVNCWTLRGRFVKEEPTRIDDALRRSKKLMGTLVTLKK